MQFRAKRPPGQGAASHLGPSALCRQTAARFARADRGGVAMLTALLLPPILLVSLGAVQLQAVFSDRSKTQDVADSAALWGAQQLTVTPVGADARAKAYAEAQLGGVQANSEVTVTATVMGENTMKVVVDTYRPSFFFNLLPFGGFNTHAEAIAEGVSQTPLCVMTFGTTSTDKLDVSNTSKVRAPQCLIHANEQIVVSTSATLAANTIETGASASGPMSPAASTGAPDVADPFTGLDISNGGVLSCVGSLLSSQSYSHGQVIPPGPHCRSIMVAVNATVTLAPGEHYFADDLLLKPGSTLLGDDVVLVFGPNGTPKFRDGTSVRISGRKTGALAGFVVVATRNRTNYLELESDSIDELTGTIYVPSTELRIDGAGQAAQASDWTVMAAKAIKSSSTADIQINANYYGSDVPVPVGVGNKSKTEYTRLSQ